MGRCRRSRGLAHMGRARLALGLPLALLAVPPGARQRGGGGGGFLGSARFHRSTAAKSPRQAKAKAAEEQAALFEHLDLEYPVLHGDPLAGRASPVVFLLAPQSEALAAYIRDDPLGPFTVEMEWPDEVLHTAEPESREQSRPMPPGLWQRWDFQPSAKEPFLLKADWHSVEGWGKNFEVFVPRKDEMVRALKAPRRLLAFLEAFRDCNSRCWLEIVAGLQQLKTKATSDIDRQRLLDLLIAAFMERGHFASIEAQAGPAFKSREMRWHKDGATGLLHLGITLDGQRKLSFWTGGHGQESRSRELLMTPGHFYLTSPFFFDHGVSYEPRRAEGDGPTLALMCRFGFLNEKDALWVNHYRGVDMLEVAEVFASCLQNATDERRLRLPSLGEVKDMEALLTTK